MALPPVRKDRGAMQVFLPCALGHLAVQIQFSGKVPSSTPFTYVRKESDFPDDTVMFKKNKLTPQPLAMYIHISSIY